MSVSRVYNLAKVSEVWRFAQVSDSDPAHPFSMDGSIGSHYLLLDTGDAYLLKYWIVGHRGALEPGFPAADGLVLLPKDIGGGIAKHVLAPLGGS